MNKFIGLDGKEIHFEEVEKGMLCEVEKKELVGGVFEVGESCFQISFSGDVFQGSVFRCDEYGTAKGLTWKTREEAERKVEIDNLIAKHRIANRDELKCQNTRKYYIYYDAYCDELLWDMTYSCTYGMTFAKAGAEEICEKISKDEWLKFVELAR